MTRSTDELRRIFGASGGKLEALVDTPGEVWARQVEGYVYVLRVAREGRVVDPADASALPRSRAKERHVFWRLADRMVLEREVHDEGVVVRRAHLNGPVHTSLEPADAATPRGELLPGFRAVSPWEIQPFGRFHRQYVRRENGNIAEVWVVSTKGVEVATSGGVGKPWYEDPKVETCASPESAVARAEELIAERLRAGFELYLIELLDAIRHHPTPPLEKTPDPCRAVDAAVERVRALRRRYPRGHFLVEELDPVRDADTLSAFGYGKSFVEMHAGKFDRWNAIPEAIREGSSFEYFLTRYGSLTWIVSGAIDRGLPMFYCGNVTGGGWCCLEVGDIDVDLSVLDEGYPGLGYGEARAFHGGWGQTGYLFDRRVASMTGEHPIYPFSLDGPMDDLMPETPIDPEGIEPFGHWLEREVHAIASELVHRLPYVQSE